jgi:hypothetical protein
MEHYQLKTLSDSEKCRLVRQRDVIKESNTRQKWEPGKSSLTVQTSAVISDDTTELPQTTFDISLNLVICNEQKSTEANNCNHTKVDLLLKTTIF